MSRKRTISVRDVSVSVIEYQQEDYISLTDMIRAKEGDFFIADWLRNRNTVEYLGIWECINNPLFNYGEFDIIKSKAGLHSYRLSAREWIQKTNAIGIKSTAGRYGGTYAHKDIAFEFGMWISPEFKIYLIKEFQRLKDEENKRLSLEWNLQRMLAKVNYRIHTDAIKENLIPHELSGKQKSITYANEADMLNTALFGLTAAEWREANPNLAGNIRDYASLEQLVVLSNLESINAVMIHQGLNQLKRLYQLNQVAIIQMKSLVGYKTLKQLSK
jgi:hypothetical protein